MADELTTVVVSVLGGIGTGLVGLIGFNLQQRYAANTTQLSSTLLEIEQLTDKCAAVGKLAWSEAGNPDSMDVAEVICLLHEIGAYVRFVTDRVTGSKLKLNPALINYRNAASGDDFDVRGRSPDPKRVLDIRAAAAALKIACREVDHDRRRVFLPFTQN